MCENSESEKPVENAIQITFTLAQMWDDLSIVSVVLCFKCHSIPIN